MSKPRRRPSAAMVVAIAALVVAMTGSAIAGPLKTLIDGSSIKKHSIPANRLINHSLTGQQVNLAKLGKVPQAQLAARATSAKTAANAANAAKLGGLPPSSYLPASKVLRWNFKMAEGNANQGHSFTFGPLKFTATCMNDSGNTDGDLSVTSSESMTYVNFAADDEPMSSSGRTVGPGSSYDIMSVDSTTTDDGNSSEFEAFDPAGKIAVFSTAQTMGVAINTPGAACRFFGFLVNDA
jgi:hypothetical protein